jgi:hypothetical protein
LKKIRDYLRENGVYIRKEARKLIADGLLGAIHKPTPLTWPTDDPADDPTDDSTDDPTPALPSLSTAPVQIIQPTLAITLTPTSARITQAIDQLALKGNFGREITNLAKLYIDEVKYSSKQDNFNFKFKIF